MIVSNKFLQEACVESFSEAFWAEKNGADLIELCSNLFEDGLTPSESLIKETHIGLNIPIKVMIRPRSGDFTYSKNDISKIKTDIDMCLDHNVKEIVFGATLLGQLDISLIKKVAKWARNMDITIHKAIDVVSDPLNDILKLKDIPNIKSILSSGKAPTAALGAEMLLKMKRKCSNRLNLIAAGKITSSNVIELHHEIGLNHYHGRKIVPLEDILNKKDQLYK